MGTGADKIDMISEILDIRNLTVSRSSIGLPVAMMERLVGIKAVDIYFSEPDPAAYQWDYYYNSRLNKLYRKITTSPIPVWKPVN